MLRKPLVIALAAVVLAYGVPLRAADHDTIEFEADRGVIEGSELSDGIAKNAAPCGRDTIAVINTDRGSRYIFCAADEGTATIEVLASGNASESLIDRYDDPTSLLHAVLPKGAQVPPQVALAIEKGYSIPTPGTAAMPFTLGVEPVVHAASQQAKAACATPPLNTNGFSANAEFFHDSTYCGLVDTHSISANNSSWHHQWASNTFDAGGNEGSHTHAGPHYDYGDGVITYYADEDEDGGGRFGRALVQTCGGGALFQGWLKASPTTGSWNSPVVEYNVPAYALYIMRLWANAQHSVWMGYDADDIRFKVTAQNGGSFGSRMYFAKYGWGTQCAIKY